MNITTKTTDKHEEIAKLAYELWDQAGRRQGRDLEHWIEAEKQFQANVQGGTKRQPTVQGNLIR